MKHLDFDIIKSSGDKTRFSIKKLSDSLKRSGADQKTIDQILTLVIEELYHGISTKEIYNRAFALLKKEKPVFALKYKLKKAIYELGPTGFPFEQFVAAILTYSGYKTEVGKILNGYCVSHEVDVIARKNDQYLLVECKFHSEEGRNCNVKVPLYIHSRYQDIIKFNTSHNNDQTIPDQGWVVTNTRFTKDAIQYGSCAGLYLISWDYPKNNGLKDRIDRLGLYPITVSTLLSGEEKNFLLNRNIVLCRQLIDQTFYLDHLGITEQRKQSVIEEIISLCDM